MAVARRRRNALMAYETGERGHLGELNAARRRVESFTGRAAQVVAEIKPEPIPSAGVLIGTCDGILYTTRRVEGGRDEVQKYIHKFKAADRPLLVASPDGGRLFLIGGRFTFGARGIVDHSDRS